jgi:hypothetical protein
MFRAHVLIIRRSKLHYTASGITTPIGCRLVDLSQYIINLMHKICFTISFISCLCMFRAHLLIIRRSKLHYTASGIITPIGGRLVDLSQYLTNLMHHILFHSKFISCLYMFRAHVLIMRRSKLHYTASGIITPIGGRLVDLSQYITNLMHKICFTINFISYFYMFRTHVL